MDDTQMVIEPNMTPWPCRAQIALALSVLVGYVLLFFLLYPGQGAETAAFVVLPVAVVGWLWGLRAGLIAGLLSLALNTLLLHLAGGQGGWDVIWRIHGGPGTLAVVLIGMLTGYMSDLRQGVQQELVERRSAEETLRQSEQRFRTLVEGSIQGILVYRHAKPLFVNRAYAHILGYESPDEILRMDSAVSLIAPHERERLLGYRTARLRGEPAPNRYECDLVRQDGAIITVDHIVTMITWAEMPALLSTIIDISERKRTEAALRASEETLRRQEEALRQAKAELETRVAARTADLQAALSRMEALYTITRTAITSEHWPAALQQIVDCVATAISANRVSLIMFDQHEQRVLYFICGGPGREQVVTTVSFDELMDGLTGWVIREGRSARTPKGAPDPRESAAVLQRRAATHCGAIAVAPVRYQDQVLGAITAINLPEERDFSEADIELIEAIAGQVAIAHARASLYERLQHATARLAGILDIADDAIIAVNGRQEVELFNQGAERTFGYTAQEVIGRSLNMLLPAQIVAAHHQHIQTFAASGDVARRMGERRDIFGRRRDGTEFPAEASISKLTAAEAPVFTVILRDITARKQVETHLRASLREKEILLQEVHHRVKNNLQVIKSLLRLQAYTITDPALHELFRDSQNRVHAMALVHEQIYRAQDLAHVDFATYVRELASSVLRSYGARSTQVGLAFEIDDAVALDIDTAVPLGLILTELISNSAKHAFCDGQTGTIAIGLHCDADNLVLVVRDDGVGIPETFDLQATGSLGFQLVSDLTDQLGGTLAIERRSGACFQIRIPHKTSKEQ